MAAPRTLENPPPLAIDARIGHVPAGGRQERRIVWHLLKHLASAGFTPVAVHADDTSEATTPEQVMELVFNLDTPVVEFTNERMVMLVLGNVEDIVSDWTYGQGDPDGFSAAMDAFDPEAYL